MKPINWELTLQIKTKEAYSKLIAYLGKSDYLSFSAEPNEMLFSTTVYKVVISCAWTENLKDLAKWVDKHIPDQH